MNLGPPPVTGNKPLDEWLDSLYSFLQYQANELMKFMPRSAPSGADQGTIYYDSTGEKLKVKTSTGWEDCN